MHKSKRRKKNSKRGEDENENSVLASPHRNKQQISKNAHSHLFIWPGSLVHTHLSTQPNIIIIIIYHVRTICMHYRWWFLLHH